MREFEKFILENHPDPDSITMMDTFVDLINAGGSKKEVRTGLEWDAVVKLAEEYKAHENGKLQADVDRLSELEQLADLIVDDNWIDADDIKTELKRILKIKVLEENKGLALELHNQVDEADELIVDLKKRIEKLKDLLRKLYWGDLMEEIKQALES